MNQAVKTKGLGRGLSSLMGETLVSERSDSAATAEGIAVKTTGQGGITTLPVEQLRAGKYQPRRHFNDDTLEELSASIAQHGLMQPIVVRALHANAYEIIAGERRWRAAQKAQLTDVPVIIRSANDQEALELALIENIQRADLNPLEEAAGYQRLMDEFGYTQERLAPMVGKSRSHIANLLRLLKLPDSVKKRIDSGALTMGHARAILMAKDPEHLARQIVDVGLSVRQAEAWAKGIEPDSAYDDGVKETPATTTRGKSGSGTRRASAGNKSDDVVQLETMLAESLGLPVSIEAHGAHAGEVVIAYENLSQLDEILRRLGGGM